MLPSHSLVRLASGALVSGIATLALAAPADAVLPKDPDVGGGIGTIGDRAPAVTSDSGWDLTPVVTGALGGVVLAGAGVATAAGLRRHRHIAHPA